jgi:hypothetical protein
LRIARAALRDRRIDRIEAGKSALWRADLRISQSANVAILAIAGGFLMLMGWTWTALVPGCVFAVGGMWAVALRMRPRETRLCRHMMFLARHRRRCAICRYCIQGLTSRQCPECGFPFDPADNRHLLIPQLNRIYSQQGREVGAVAIAAVMIGMTLIAQKANWQSFALWSLGLLIAFHGLYAAWMLSVSAATVRKREAREFNGTDVEVKFDAANSIPESEISQHILRHQYLGLLLRWAFLTALVTGIHFNLSVGNAFLPTTFGKSAVIASIIARISIWIITVAFAAGYLGRRLRHRAIISLLQSR